MNIANEIVMLNRAYNTVQKDRLAKFMLATLQGSALSSDVPAKIVEKAINITKTAISEIDKL